MARDPQPRTPDSGWGYVIAGAIASIIGALILSEDGGALAWAFIWIGSVLTAAGTIGIGVTIALDRAEHLRNH